MTLVLNPLDMMDNNYKIIFFIVKVNNIMFLRKFSKATNHVIVEGIIGTLN